MKVRRLDKMPRRKVTVGDLLDRDTVKHIIDDIVEHLNDIEDIVVIYTYGDSIYHSHNVDGVRFIQLLETVKFDKLHERLEK